MNTFVIDASIAIKWVVEEDGTAQALLLRQAKLLAPDLLTAECANVLWKKVGRREMSRQEALLAARLLQGADVELLPTKSFLEAATRIAIDLDHPAYDCVYLALAAANGFPFVTADRRFLRKIEQGGRNAFRASAVSLDDAIRLIASLTN